MDTGAELRQNSEALRMIRFEVSTTITLAEDTVSRLAGPPVESMRFLDVEAEQSGSRMITLLAVISWYTDLGRGDEEEGDGDGEMDKDGVRQAGGLGGARPVCRVEGLIMEKDEIRFKLGWCSASGRPFSHSLASNLTFTSALTEKKNPFFLPSSCALYTQARNRPFMPSFIHWWQNNQSEITICAQSSRQNSLGS